MQIRNYDMYRMFDGFYERKNTSTYLLELVQKQRHRQKTYVCTETESRYKIHRLAWT